MRATRHRFTEETSTVLEQTAAEMMAVVEPAARAGCAGRRCGHPGPRLPGYSMTSKRWKSSEFGLKHRRAMWWSATSTWEPRDAMLGV